MSRRIEGQLSRDWNFGFVSWNYVFRSAVNLSRTLYTYETVKETDGVVHKLTPDMLEKGAVKIMRGLYGYYTNVNGETQKVNGDMTKVRWVPEVSQCVS